MEYNGKELFTPNAAGSSMFRLFLMNKVPPGDAPHSRPKLPRKQYKNRRLYERFHIDHKHISLLNDHDILNIRDISENGFSCEVDERCLLRLKVGDTYRCRLRYLNEIYELMARVAWKTEPFIGFALAEPSPRMEQFLSRIITPARIGLSLKTLDASLKKMTFEQEPLQFFGEDQTRLVVWENDAKGLESWYFEYQNKYLKWESYRELETGKLLNKEESSLSKPWEQAKRKDEKADPNLRQFALDVFMVLDFPRSENLLESLQKKT
jgi:hypothetical protein